MVPCLITTSRLSYGDQEPSESVRDQRTRQTKMCPQDAGCQPRFGGRYTPDKGDAGGLSAFFRTSAGADKIVRNGPVLCRPRRTPEVSSLDEISEFRNAVFVMLAVLLLPWMAYLFVHFFHPDLFLIDITPDADVGQRQ